MLTVRVPAFAGDTEREVLLGPGAALAHPRVCRRGLTCAVHGHRYSLHDRELVSGRGGSAGCGGQLNLLPTRLVGGRAYAVVDSAVGA